MTTYQESEKDLATKTERSDIVLSLTDKQYTGLTLDAYKAGFENVSELLEAFVGDLTGWHGNGSDEEMYAERWYKRAFYYEVEEHANFRHFLYNYNYDTYDLRLMAGCYDNDPMDEEELSGQEAFEECYAEYEQENFGKTLDPKEECMKTIKKIVLIIERTEYCRGEAAGTLTIGREDYGRKCTDREAKSQ